MFLIYTQWAIYGVVVGALAAFLVLYALQPRTVYPAWAIFLFDQPWIILLFGLYGLYLLLLVQDRILGSLLVLLAASLFVDRANFATHLREKKHLDQGRPAQALQEPTTSAEPLRNDVWYEAVAHDEHVGEPTPSTESAGPSGWEELSTGQAVFHGLEEPQPGDPTPF